MRSRRRRRRKKTTTFIVKQTNAGEFTQALSFGKMFNETKETDIFHTLNH